MKQTYRVIAGVIALGVVFQAAAIAFGWFDVISGLESGLVVDENFEPNTGHMLHGMVGMYLMPLLGLVLLVVSFFAAKAVPGARKWAAIVFVAILLQVVLAIVAFSTPAVGILHGVNALIIFAAAGRAAMLVRGTRAAGTAPTSGDVPSQRAGTSSAESPLTS